MPSEKNLCDLNRSNLLTTFDCMVWNPFISPKPLPLHQTPIYLLRTMTHEPMQPIRLYPNEVFREISLDEPLQLRYAVSNTGRLISFKEDIRFGRELKGGSSDGYRLLRYKKTKNGKTKTKHLYIAKLVATYFVPKTSEDQTYVLHLDRKRDNDHYKNLQWATREEMIAFANQSPKLVSARKQLAEHNLKADGKKLTVTRVIHLKKLLQDPNRKTRLKMLAKQFGISEMQISRIKRGENWGHVRVDL